MWPSVPLACGFEHLVAHPPLRSPVGTTRTGRTLLLMVPLVPSAWVLGRVSPTSPWTGTTVAGPHICETYVSTHVSSLFSFHRGANGFRDHTATNGQSWGSHPGSLAQAGPVSSVQP